MTTRNAAIRLTLDSGSFASEMRSLTGKVAASGRLIGSAFSTSMSAGFGAARRSLADIGSSLKSTIKQYGTLAGTIATGMLTRDAIVLQGLYRNLAFDIGKTTGSAITWRDVQKDVDSVVDKTGQRAKTMIAAYADLYSGTGNAEYSRKILESIGTAATASGKDVGLFANAGVMMMEKFNIAAEDVPDAMAAIEQMTGRGALKLDDLNGRFGVLAGEAKVAGMTGTSGMRDLLGLFQLLDDELGDNLSPQLKKMFQVMKPGTTQAKQFAKLGVTFEPDMSFFDKFKKLLSSERIRKQAELTFKGSSLTAFNKLAEPFDKAMKEAKEKGFRKAEQVDYAMKALDKSFAAASEATWNYADLQRKSAQRMSDDPSLKLQAALGKLERAFSQPKMISAIEKLADKLPVLADKLVDLVDWAATNPWKAAGAAAGVKIGAPALSAFIGAGAALGLKSIGAGLAKVGGAAAGGLSGAFKAARIAASGFGAATTAGAAGTSSLVAGTAMVAGSALVGAGIGYTGYKVGIEPQLESWSKKLRSLDELLITAEEQITRKKPETAKLKDMLAQIKAAKKESEPGLVVSALSALTSPLGAESADKQRITRVSQLTEAETRLLKILARLADGADGAAHSLKKIESPSVPSGTSSPNPGTIRGIRKPTNNAPGFIPAASGE